MVADQLCPMVSYYYNNLHRDEMYVSLETTYEYIMMKTKNVNSTWYVYQVPGSIYYYYYACHPTMYV